MERENKEEEEEKQVIEEESLSLADMQSSLSQLHDRRDPPSPPVDSPLHSPSSSDTTPRKSSPKEDKNSQGPPPVESSPSPATMETPSTKLDLQNPPSPVEGSPLHSPSSSEIHSPELSPIERKQLQIQPLPLLLPAKASSTVSVDSPLHSPSSSERTASPVAAPAKSLSSLPSGKPPSTVSADSPLHSPSPSERTASPAVAPAKPPSPAVTQFPPPRPPRPQFRPPSPATDSPLHSLPSSTKASPATTTAAANRYVPEEAVTVSEEGHRADDGYAKSGDSAEATRGGDGGSRGKKWGRDLSILKRARREKMVKRALMGLRVCGLIFCLVSFSVMAADKYKGWALDSYFRYKEFRYCMAVNVIGFAYSVLQAFDVAHYMASGKHWVEHRMRYFLDFSLDQIISYLLISASSSAATRIEDWESNWGRDKFTKMAFTSVIMSFMAFGAFALSSIISGYNLFTLNFI